VLSIVFIDSYANCPAFKALERDRERERGRERGRLTSITLVKRFVLEQYAFAIAVHQSIIIKYSNPIQHSLQLRIENNPV